VLDLLVRGRSNAQIAEELGISLEGAKWHVREVLEVTGAGSREEAAEIWRAENGLPRRLWRMTWSAGWVAAAFGAAVAIGVAFFVGLIAFSGDDERNGTEAPETSATAAPPTAAFTATAGSTPPAPPTVPRTLGSPSRATGVEFVDYVTAHLESNVSLRPEDLQGQLLPCASGFNTAPDCPAGAPEGTLVLSIITFQCEIGWNPLSTDAQVVDGRDQLTLHSVIRGGLQYTRPPAADATPDYWMLFMNSAPNFPPGFAVAVKDGKVVSWGRSCGPFESLATRRSEGASGYLLPPPE
jgi:hypothetical protein